MLPCATHRWLPPALADIKALVGVAINMGAHPVSDTTELLVSSMGEQNAFLSDVFPRNEFLLLFWNPHFAPNDGQGKVKKEDLIKFV
jgi:hypothetical protein